MKVIYKDKNDYIKKVFNTLYKLPHKCSCGSDKYYKLGFSIVLCFKCFICSTFENILYIPNEEGWEQLKVK